MILRENLYFKILYHFWYPFQSFKMYFPPIKGFYFQSKEVAVKKALAKHGKIYVGKLKPELTDQEIKVRATNELGVGGIYRVLHLLFFSHILLLNSVT